MKFNKIFFAVLILAMMLISGIYALKKDNSVADVASLSNESSSILDITKKSSNKIDTPEFDKPTQEAIKNCTGIEIKQASLNNLLENFAQGGEQRKYQIVNVHGVMNDGKKVRLHLFANGDSSQIDKLAPRFFSEDEEGLPIPIARPKEFDGLKSSQLLQKMHEKTNVTHIEQSYISEFTNNVAAEIEEVNGVIESLQLHVENKNLACTRSYSDGFSSMNCKCIN